MVREWVLTEDGRAEHRVAADELARGWLREIGGLNIVFLPIQYRCLDSAAICMRHGAERRLVRQGL
jgi:hypothetical protein